MSKQTLGSAAILMAATAVLAQPPGIPPVPVPPGNPITQDKANLGKVLFFDEQLSSTGTVACATCHVFGAGGSDPRSSLPGSVHPGVDGRLGTPDDISGSLGVIRHAADGSWQPDATFGFAPQVTGRKAPSVVLAAWSPNALFWDGRAGGTFTDPVSGSIVLAQGAALESQAAGPPVSDVEMAHMGRSWTQIEAAVAAAKPLALASALPPALTAWIGQDAYPQLFARAFGDPSVTAARILLAIATYERTLLADQAPFDAFLAGNPNALTAQQQRGFNIFNGPGRCNLCHAGPLLVGPVRAPGPEQGSIYVNIGVRPAAEDRGRGAITGNPRDDGKFKIPSLRNVDLRAPYFHNGSMPSLRAVVDFYNRGGDFPASPLIQPLGLSQGQRTDLVAFLTALTDPRLAAEQAPFDRPALYGESASVPVAYGRGGPGSGGIVPRTIAVEPPVLGNPSMTLGVYDGLGGAAALLLLGVAQTPPGTLVLGAPLHVDLAQASVLVPLVLGGSGAGQGFASLDLAVPASPQGAGLTGYVQLAVVDAGAPQGLATTAGTRLTLFAPR